MYMYSMIIVMSHSTGASSMQSHHLELSNQAGSSTSSSPGLTCKSVNLEAGYVSGDEEEWMEPPLSKVRVLHNVFPFLCAVLCTIMCLLKLADSCHHYCMASLVLSCYYRSGITGVDE